jgi:hypothetical protein
MRRHAVSDIYTTDHNRLLSVDCDAFGLTANVSGIKVWVIPLHLPQGKLQIIHYISSTIHRYNLRHTPSRTLREELTLTVYRPDTIHSVAGTFKEVPEYLSAPLSPLSELKELL